MLAFSLFVPSVMGGPSHDTGVVTHGSVTSVIVNNSATYTFPGSNHAYNGTLPFGTSRVRGRGHEIRRRYGPVWE
ncbi:MAG: hypothetical protein JRM86_01520 [Nitrososphaerota archaeon]|nr:hypothetical protein [Nitrososphaerota archaeon]MDG6966232.1 hypothetical protein [Nitrososphaerota archaeon]MDG6968446.1 hypothetical protein [Nitrososphaerota archaeon]MDG6977667.1 hypothetical protein [Nitrososphaerota archaeon]MDG7005594.1 hypothetical protein [Nitrososphaerota archaeon]